MLRFAVVVSGTLLLWSAAARGASWDESVNGDLSSNRLSPTHITLNAGANSIRSTQVSANSPTGDVDYFWLTVPPGSQLTAINVVSTTTTTLSFVAVQRGTTFTEPNVGTNVAALLGYGHFGPGNGTVGANILPSLGTGAGAIDFAPPLPAGDYTFWQQETSATPTTSTLSFVVSAPNQVPVPRGAAVVLVVGLFAASNRLLRRRSGA